ncbi:OprD family outer membrane porin [Pseudomonas antarctica]
MASADFLSDSNANLNMRNFYFNNDNRDGSAAPSKTEEWGQAFILNYPSGSNFAQLNQGGLVNKGEGGSSLYLYTDRTVQTLIQAGERSVFAQYAYDFVALGLPSLMASVMYLKGDHILTTAGNTASEWERDISLDYVVQSGTFKSVGFGWRNGVSRSEVARDQDQNRVFVSDSIALM